MTIWLALFIIIIITSFILAYLSMKDYQETPAKHSGFGIFLIQNPQTFNNAVLRSLYSDAQKRQAIITVERLFKGSKSALIITGNREILEKYTQILNLLELEDFTNLLEDYLVAWEIGLKEGTSRPIKIDDIFKDMPIFETNEQFWWQLTFHAPVFKKHTLIDFFSWLILGKKASATTFKCQIRAVLYSPDANRRAKFSEELQRLGEPILTKIPRPITSSQMFHNYKMRSIFPADSYLLDLGVDEVLQLLGKSN
jgi:hypothetical protein